LGYQSFRSFKTKVKKLIFLFYNFMGIYICVVQIINSEIRRKFFLFKIINVVQIINSEIRRKFLLSKIINLEYE